VATSKEAAPAELAKKMAQLERMPTALWLTSVVVALAHHLHISRRAHPAVESHQFGRISGS